MVGRGGVGVFPLCGSHGGQRPEGLIVVAEFPRDVGGLVVAVVAGLMDHTLCDGGVVAGVPGEGPIVDERLGIVGLANFLWGWCV